MTKAELVETLPILYAKQRTMWGNSYFWLGKGSKAGGFQWAQFGSRARLCTAADIEAYLDVKRNPLNRGMTLLIPNEVDDLTMVLEVSSKSLNYASCGLWNGPRPGAKSFTDVQLSFVGVAPSHPILAADFRKSTRNLQEITFRARAEETDALSLVSKSEDGAEHLKFEHKLFKKLTEADSRCVEGTSYFQCKTGRSLLIV
jgi:hypothetical protein